jgi:hypothetical protein
MELVQFLRLLLRRLWLVVALAVLAGGLAWLQARNDTVTYEQTLSFVLRPAAGVPAMEIDDALDGLASGETMVETVSGTLSSERFLELAGRDGGLDGDAVDDIELEASTRPGSTVVDARFAGPARRDLQAVAEPFTGVATRWVTRTYKVYTLEPLGARGPTALPGRTSAVTALGVGFGLLIGLIVVFTEGLVRSSRRQPTPPFPSGEVKYTIEGQGDDPLEMYRLEEILRQHIDDDEVVVHAGPGRLMVVERNNGTKGAAAVRRP